MRVNKLMQLTQNKDNLMRLCRASGKKILMNTRPVQRMSDKIATCARHVCTRIRFSEWSNERYHKFMQSKHLDPDAIVTMLTLVYSAGKPDDGGHYDALGGQEIGHLFK